MFKKTRNTRTTHTRTKNKQKARHSSTPHLSFPWQKLPRWVRLAGSIALIVLYVWAFYVYFVGPTGFRWRAIYGDRSVTACAAPSLCTFHCNTCVAPDVRAVLI